MVAGALHVLAHPPQPADHLQPRRARIQIEVAAGHASPDDWVITVLSRAPAEPVIGGWPPKRTQKEARNGRLGRRTPGALGSGVCRSRLVSL